MSPKQTVQLYQRIYKASDKLVALLYEARQKGMFEESQKDMNWADKVQEKAAALRENFVKQSALEVAKAVAKLAKETP